jgi:hypothetical protein
MFWKKKQTGTGATEAKPQKVKKLSPKVIITSKIEQLGPGDSASYQLAEVYGGGLAVVELNPQYPEKGRKYSLSLEKIVDGKPAGKRSHLSSSNNPKDLAGWILERGGEPYS